MDGTALACSCAKDTNELELVCEEVLGTFVAVEDPVVVDTDVVGVTVLLKDWVKVKLEVREVDVVVDKELEDVTVDVDVEVAVTVDEYVLQIGRAHV